MTRIVQKQAALGADSLPRHLLAVLVAGLVAVAPAQAGPTPADQCQAGKNKAAGKYAACRANAEAKLATSGDAQKHFDTILKCGYKLTGAWQKLQNKAVAAGSACPSVNDAFDIEDKVSATTDTVAALVGGARFEDNGDGTITDHKTGLQWEKKTSPGGGPIDPHDVDNTYAWTFGGFSPNGTVFTDILAKLNGADGGTCLVNKCDWRLPTLLELQLILPYPCGSPCIDPIFGPTAAGYYWSATTDSPNAAFVVSFADGDAFSALKTSMYDVRAVRTGP